MITQLITSLISGLYTSLWGAFKDGPYEGYKPRTFPRSVYFSVALFGILYWLPVFEPHVSSLKLFQLFFLVMGLERFLAELYKGFFRKEDQAKYFVPSRITFLGRPVENEWVRMGTGAILVLGVFVVLLIRFPISSIWQYVIVGYCSGLIVSLGGAYKDAPFEGFKILKFQRSALVVALTSPLFYWIAGPEGTIPLGYLIYMNGGLERFVVEYYKTYIQRNMSGKFRSDLPRNQELLDSREKYHYAALVIEIALAVLYAYEV